ncbi:uncharacterized protein FOMMEDRAFT_20109 [Fomitiporia mediterranea MF3/22]|uniref:uncharacterized protein n=1 Tax=Fomitiporia mediterranea (strain MF3/22) TaxID=694068 RepID=UPI0004408534|nr:uncharacterized protein FOMMEDRAFT_20109 [Fomitiporia mediterranea MF3/22]EJD02900.1 hypothetical protein FOMMEDRAFT_20109 [Fomitiporia mediterranea MF3/22]
MSTAIHSPCHSPTSSQDFLSFHSCLTDMRDSSFPSPLSPCHRPSATPPRNQPLLLSPSPLRRRVDNEFDFDSAMQLDFDDFSAATGVSTPFRRKSRFTSSPRRPHLRSEDKLPPFFRPPDSHVEDDEEGSFLRSNAGHTSLPLRTPQRLPLESIPVPNSVSSPNFSHAPKRKIHRLASSPDAKRGLTPLHIHHASDHGELKRFATLAPLPAPRFLHERGSEGNNMGQQVNTLREMRLSDKTADVDSDSGSEEEFSVLKVRRTTNRSVRPSTGDGKATVVSRSPGGHKHKRPTRSRPVSMELSNFTGPTQSPKPKGRMAHKRNGSNTSVSESGSPSKAVKQLQTRPQADRRLASSATLFFGPAIVNPNEKPAGQARMEQHIPPSTPVKTDDDSFNSTSPDSSFTSAFPKPADTSIQFSFSLTSDAPSPRSRIPTKFKKPRDSGVALSDDETEDVLRPVLEQPKLTRPDSLLRLHARASTFPQPSVNITTSSETTLVDDSLITPSHERSRESSRAETSLDVSLVDDFIVKTLEAGTKDGAAEKRPPGTPQKRMKTTFLGIPTQRPWASAAVNKMDRTPLFGERLPGPNFGTALDSGGSAGDLSIPKNRPRKSCPGDLRFPSDHETSVSGSTRLSSNGSTASDTETSPTDARLINPRNRTYGDVGMGRPSARLNASQFLLRRSSSGAFSTASDGSDGTGVGTPTKGAASKKDNELRVPMLPLRQLCTPSNRSLHLTLPSAKASPALRDTSQARHSIRSQFSLFGKRTKENRRPESMHIVGSCSEISEKRPSNSSATPLPVKAKLRGHHGDTRGSHLAHLPSFQSREALGRFEREFVEVDKIGSGEFGSAIKVRYKHDSQGDRVYAVKKSKRYEGNRHRSRLREEVQVLQYLSACAGPEFHPNVLGYVDSWEQDDQLYILTELCDFGNFAHFLNEYGHHFARLEEARVWKIFAEISSGLRFMHQANVVHFDLKPANVFITAAGRFKIGDFGMASLWPRPPSDGGSVPEGGDVGRNIGFEREGDKMYLAAEVLQGRYGKETDIFSFGMMMLETATNICVPTQGDSWHRLREQDFSQVEGFTECSDALQFLISSMMSKDPSARPSANDIYAHPVVFRARARMEALHDDLREQGESRPEILFRASPLASVDDSFLPDILGEDVVDAMEVDCNA